MARGRSRHDPTILRASADGFALLLERCEPGQDLWTVARNEQIEVMADLLPRRWLADRNDTLPDLADTAARWMTQLHSRAAAVGVPTAIADRARRWAEELADAQPRRLLHGDAHPGNVLAAERQPWLAIDPKPCIGYPALAARLSLDPDRMLRWAVIKAIAWSFGRDETIVVDRAARSA